MTVSPHCLSFFFFNHTATTEIYTLSLHDALPIWTSPGHKQVQPRLLLVNLCFGFVQLGAIIALGKYRDGITFADRSEEHTSELQSLTNLVCRLLLEKKKKKNNYYQRNKITVSILI